MQNIEQKIPTKNLSNEMANFPFIFNNLIKPDFDITENFEKFIESTQNYFNQVSQFINNFLKKMNSVYGKTLMMNVNYKSNHIFNEIMALKKEVNNPNSTFFASFKSPTVKIYSIKRFVQFVDNKIEEIIILANELIEKHRSNIKRILYTNSLNEFFQTINNEENEAKIYFKNLEENIAKDKLIPNSLKINTEITKEKRISVFKNFFDEWKNKKKFKTFFDKKTQQSYEYSLVGFYKKYDKLKAKQERLFWECEVAKVKILNKPHKDVNNQLNSFSEYIIDLENVVKYYSNGVTTNKVLRGLNLKVPEGEFVVILGPSGSGKTTLLNIISGMDRASSGKTIIANKNLIFLSDTKLTEFRKNNIGYIFQQYGLLPNLTVRENIEIGAHLQKDPAKRLNIDDLLKDIGMYEHRNKLPAELSGGQQQRVSVARAIAKNPKIIFGDEPTGALDEEMTQIVLQQFVDINKKYKTTLIIVTHNPLIAEIATFVIKVGDGVIKSVIKNPNPKQIKDVKWSS